MTFSATIKSPNGRYCASLVQAPQVTAHGSTPDEALKALREELRRRVEREDIVRVDPVATGVNAFAGIFADDDSLTEIMEEAYRQRDLERDRLFGDDSESSK